MKEITFETMVLSELTKLHDKVDRGLEQGRENSEDLKILRKELGIDGAHGRLPIVEAAQIGHEERLSALERERIEAGARHKLMAAATSLLSGGVGGTVIALIAKVMHL